MVLCGCNLFSLSEPSFSHCHLFRLLKSDVMFRSPLFVWPTTEVEPPPLCVRGGGLSKLLSRWNKTRVSLLYTDVLYYCHHWVLGLDTEINIWMGHVGHSGIIITNSDSDGNCCRNIEMFISIPYMISGTKRAVFRWELWGWIITELQCSHCFGPFSESRTLKFCLKCKYTIIKRFL